MKQLRGLYAQTFFTFRTAVVIDLLTAPLKFIGRNEGKVLTVGAMHRGVEQLQSLNSALNEEMSFNPLNPGEKSPHILGFTHLKRFFGDSR